MGLNRFIFECFVNKLTLLFLSVCYLLFRRVCGFTAKSVSGGLGNICSITTCRSAQTDLTQVVRIIAWSLCIIINQGRQDVRIEDSRTMFSSFSSKFLDFFDPKFVKNDGAISKEELPEILSN